MPKEAKTWSKSLFFILSGFGGLHLCTLIHLVDAQVSGYFGFFCFVVFYVFEYIYPVLFIVFLLSLLHSLSERVFLRGHLIGLLLILLADGLLWIGHKRHPFYDIVLKKIDIIQEKRQATKTSPEREDDVFKTFGTYGEPLPRAKLLPGTPSNKLWKYFSGTPRFKLTFPTPRKIGNKTGLLFDRVVIYQTYHLTYTLYFRDDRFLYCEYANHEAKLKPPPWKCKYVYFREARDRRENILIDYCNLRNAAFRKYSGCPTPEE